MLVLSRKVNETLIIGENIKVTILGVEGEQVRIGIEAPREIRVLRREVFDAIQEANRLAAQAGTAELAELAGLIEQVNKEKGKK